MCHQKLFYKYYSNIDLNFSKLEKGEISFTSIATMNDPTEGFSAFCLQNAIPATNVIETQPKKLSEQKLSEDATEIISYTRSIFCLTERFDNLLMWAHYANSHQGFCVGYAIEDIMAVCDLKISFRKVDYRESPLEIGDLRNTDESKKLDSMIFQKSLCWAYEQEWRGVIRNNPQSNIPETERHLFLTASKGKHYRKYVDKPCAAKVVYMGCNMREQDRLRIAYICQEKNIELYCMERISNSYEIKSKPLNIENAESLKELSRKLCY